MLKDNFSYFASCYGTSKHDKNTVIFSRISEYIGPLIAFTEEPQNTLNAAANQRRLKSTKIDFLDLNNWKYSAAFAQLAGFKLENAFVRRKIFIFINLSIKYIHCSIFCCKTTFNLTFATSAGFEVNWNTIEGMEMFFFYKLGNCAFEIATVVYFYYSQCFWRECCHIELTILITWRMSNYSDNHGEIAYILQILRPNVRSKEVGKSLFQMVGSSLVWGLSADIKIPGGFLVTLGKSK